MFSGDDKGEYAHSLLLLEPQPFALVLGECDEVGVPNKLAGRFVDMDPENPHQELLIQRWPSKRSASLPHVPYLDAICPPSTTNVVPVM